MLISAELYMGENLLCLYGNGLCISYYWLGTRFQYDHRLLSEKVMAQQHSKACKITGTREKGRSKESLCHVQNRRDSHHEHSGANSRGVNGKVLRRVSGRKSMPGVGEAGTSRGAGRVRLARQGESEVFGEESVGTRLWAHYS